MYWWALLKLRISTNAITRMQAVEEMGRTKEARAVKPLVAALKDSDFLVREKAAEVLGEIGDARVVEPLVAALEDKWDGAREKAAKALVKIGKTAVEPLIAALKDDDVQVRQGAATALEEIRDSRALDSLIEVLEDRDCLVRMKAAEALGKIGDARAVEPLVAALRDDDLYVRKEIAVALGMIGNERAVNPLVAVLKDNYRSVREAAAEALVALGWQPLDERERALLAVAHYDLKEAEQLGVAAVEALLIALKGCSWDEREKVVEALVKIGDGTVEPLLGALKDSDFLVRGAAAKALGEIRHSRAVESLLAALEDKRNEVRERAAEALEKIGKACAGELLPGEFKDSDWAVVLERAAEVQRGIRNARAIEALMMAITGCDHSLTGQIKAAEAAEALVRFGDAAVEPLVNALRASYHQGRVAAARALGEIGDARAVEPLIKALNDNWRDVQSEAARALGEIGDACALGPLMEVRETFKDREEDRDNMYLASITAIALGKIGDTCAVESLVSVDTEILLVVADLPPVYRYQEIQEYSPGDSPGFTLMSIEVNCSRLRHLAQQELMRRRIQA